MRVVVLFLFLIACGRGLTDQETRFLNDIHGETLDTAPIRIMPSNLIGHRARERPARPRTTCRELIKRPPEGDTITLRTAGMVGFNQMFVRSSLARSDFLKDFPAQMDLPHAMFFAHEMTHVWQWQNRQITNYHPLKGLSEHQPGVDPYLFDTAPDARFLSYGYEQQASIVQEYVCCRALDPAGARTARLFDLLSEVMDPALPQSTPHPAQVILPWQNAEIRGICS